MPQSTLASKHCQACDKGGAPLEDARVEKYLKDLSGWQKVDGAIVKTFKFENYHETMAFVNATAWISHRENHHPDLLVTYNKCEVRYWTHAVGGLSENDFICAAKIDALLQG